MYIKVIFGYSNQIVYFVSDDSKDSFYISGLIKIEFIAKGNNYYY